MFLRFSPVANLVHDHARHEVHQGEVRDADVKHEEEARPGNVPARVATSSRGANVNFVSISRSVLEPQGVSLWYSEALMECLHTNFIQNGVD